MNPTCCGHWYQHKLCAVHTVYHILNRYNVCAAYYAAPAPTNIHTKRRRTQQHLYCEYDIQFCCELFFISKNMSSALLLLAETTCFGIDCSWAENCVRIVYILSHRDTFSTPVPLWSVFRFANRHCFRLQHSMKSGKVFTKQITMKVVYSKKM